MHNKYANNFDYNRAVYLMGKDKEGLQENTVDVYLVNEDEKGLLKLIETKSPILLNDLKALTGLSNKKWDKSLKGLTKNNLAKVNNTVEGLFVEIV